MSCAISDSPADIDDLIRLARRRSPAGPRVVAIDGRAGSGKTMRAGKLAEQLGRDRSFVVHMDDLYAGWDSLAGAPSYLRDTVLEPLRRGGEGRFEPWDWYQSRRIGRIVVPRREWIIVEGVGSGSGEVRAYLSALIWLEADEHVRRQRGLGRDGDTFRPHWRRWAQQEAALLEAEQTQAHADLVIHT